MFKAHWTALSIIVVLIPPFVCRAAEPKVVELIGDPTFARGLNMRGIDGKSHAITWTKDPAGQPIWSTAHHGSKARIADAKFQSFPPGGFVFKDDYAWLAIHPPDEQADFILGLNAFREYDGHYRALGDPWPHLYLEQRVSNPGGHLGATAPSIAEMAKLDFSARVRLLYDHRHVGQGYDAHVHAAQFLFFFTVQNLKRSSGGFGDYYWFGIAFYDDRKPVTELLAMQDRGSEKKKGTDKFIYNVGMKPFTQKIVADGQWVDVQGDILPHIVAGLKDAWKRGFLPASNDIGDYYIGGVVLGWEIPGLNDAAAAVSGLSAKATLHP